MKSFQKFKLICNSLALSLSILFSPSHNNNTVLLILCGKQSSASIVEEFQYLEDAIKRIYSNTVRTMWIISRILVKIDRKWIIANGANRICTNRVVTAIWQASLSPDTVASEQYMYIRRFFFRESIKPSLSSENILTLRAFYEQWTGTQSKKSGSRSCETNRQQAECETWTNGKAAAN